ncbi:MAG: error-prone DNA polymerase [Candidatus Acidiferrum sp.]
MYTELHACSAFSFLGGASLPEELIGVCAAQGMTAMALLDRDGVYGAPRFHLAAQNTSIRALIGAEVTSPQGWRYSLLVESRTGYQNLCRAITQMKLRAKKGQGDISHEELSFHAQGLVCLTGGEEGPLAHALTRGGMESGIACVNTLCEIFGRENVFIELQRHYNRAEEQRNQAVLQIARQLHLPLLATNGVRHALPEQRELLDVFTCIRNHRTLATVGRLLVRNAERHVKSPAEMQRLFADLPEAIANTQLLASRLQFTLSDLGYHFPIYPVPPGQSQMDFLRQRTYEGMIARYGDANERARRQIDHELAIIGKLDLPGYFLIVWDIVRFCAQQNILIQGRGSAANSAVCYALGITAVDPVGMELLFERFLSEERGEWPDIDLDLPSGEQRERAIQYVYERYGKLGAAMTANVITYRGRSAAREIGKAFSFDPEILKRLTSLVGAWEYQDASDTLDRQFRDAGLDLQHPRIRKFLELCLKFQDLPRHLGQHSGGMVICQGQLDSIVPLEPASMPGRVVVQWDKEDCTDMGIVKVDLLGLGMMAVLEDTLKIIRDDYGEEIDLGHLPANDPLVYHTLQKADTVGMFQIESRAQMACLPRLKPVCFYDIVVQVAIIRPGPIVGQMVNPYLKRRQGREPVECLHPSLETVLARTLGVPLFQEQLLRMAMIAAGFTGGEAEELRRALGFKRSEQRMKEVEKKLRRGMEKNGISGEAQEKIVRSITSFALYGFPESHAASFALIAYASAYFKCHYLAAFTTAMLNNQPMGFYRPATLVTDAQRHGLRVRPIDVTCSDWLCTLEKGEKGFAMRMGLRYVKGLRASIAEEIVRERNVRPFVSMEDVKRRVPGIQKAELATLAEVGALNHVGEQSSDAKSGSAKSKNGFHRRSALWQIERAVRSAGPLYEADEDCEESAALLDEGPNILQRALLPMTSEERLVADFRGTGLSVGPHPMSFHRAEMRARGVRCASELAALPDGMQVRIAGAIIARQRPGTAKGFVFLSMEDETGIANAIITPQLFQNYHVMVVHQQFLLIEGQLQNQDNVVSVKAERIEALEITRAETTSHDFH